MATTRSSPESTMFALPKVQVASLKQCIASEEEPIAKRMRTVFMLKQIGGHEAIDALCSCFTSQSVLLKHEVCYVLGQLQDVYASPFLKATLKNINEHPIVRHEAAEAMAALGDQQCVELLQQIANAIETPIEVRDTCLLSLDMLRWKLHNSGVDASAGSKYMSHDPAPAFEKVKMSAVELGDLLVDQNKGMFDRYRAMFSLRNLDTEEAVHQLARGFTNDPNALFKHEIAFVFGQMQNKASIVALNQVLSADSEHAMVVWLKMQRHEAAEALGSVGSSNSCGQDVEPMLRPFSIMGPAQLDPIVKESCEVALDIKDYWRSDQFDTAF